MDPSLVVTPPQMLLRGLKAIKIDRATQESRGLARNINDFKSHFSLHPNQASTLWSDLFAHDKVSFEDVELSKDGKILTFKVPLEEEKVYSFDFSSLRSTLAESLTNSQAYYTLIKKLK